MKLRLLRFGLGVLCLGLLPACIVRERLDAPKIVGDGTGYVFFYDDIGASEVHLAGDFNDWGPTAGGRIRKGDRKNIAFSRRSDGVWTVAVPYKEHVRDPQYNHLDDEVYLEHGKRYRYKLIVNGGTWITDPSNPSKVRESDGNENSLLVAP